MYHYFPFTIIGDYTGDYSQYSSTSFNIPTGNVGQPADILKFNAGTDAWSQSPSTYTFLNGTLDITSLSGTDWTPTLKNNWFDGYLNFVGLGNKLTPSEKTTIYNYLELQDIFQLLSSPSVAYVTKNDGTNGLIIDPYLTNEVSIGLNVFHSPYILNYANTLPNNTTIKNKIFTNHRQGDILVSNVCKVTYNGFIDYVWCFDGLEFNDYNISSIGLIPSLTNGGGNFFGEIKLAGNNIQAHYIVKKNVNHNDPTFGLVTGEGKPFCFGDEIIIIDTTCWTTNSTSGWSWIGDYSQLQYQWDIADVTNSCTDYANVEISSMLFPLRIIQFCQFLNFG